MTHPNFQVFRVNQMLQLIAAPANAIVGVMLKDFQNVRTKAAVKLNSSRQRFCLEADW